MGVVLLMLFILSNTPTRALHHLFADHKDTAVQVNCIDRSAPNIHSSGLNCHCNSNVVIAPYLAAELPTWYPPRFFHFRQEIPKTASPAFKTVLIIGLRAPPSV